jgi:hypothetical protein
MVLQALDYLNSSRRYQQLPGLSKGESESPQPSTDAYPSVSVIIPARNEAHRLPTLLASLERLDSPVSEVLVVDDGSTDGTGEVARAARCTVLRVEDPPTGWTGKNWAAWSGAKRTAGTWIAFVDADVDLEPHAIRIALAEAHQSGAALISLFLQQQCLTFWERVLLPYAFCLYFAGGGGRRVNSDPSHALANGQFILVRRNDYLAVGGHQSIRSSVIDDIALARRFLEHGKVVEMRRAEQLGRVRMYENLATIRAGFAKNAVQFSASSSSGWITVAASIVGASLAWRMVRRPSLGGFAGAGLSAIAIAPWYERFEVPRRYALLHPVAALIFQLIAIDATVCRLLGASTWKGRRLP